MTGECGSYRYMAPEVFSHGIYDHKVDIYSFGVIVSELTENKHFMGHLGPIPCARAVLRGQRPDLRRARSLGGLDRIIAHAWDPEVDLPLTALCLLSSYSLSALCLISACCMSALCLPSSYSLPAICLPSVCSLPAVCCPLPSQYPPFYI